MKTTKNQEILKKLDAIAKTDDTWMAKVESRKDNREWLKISAKIAVKILRVLRDKGMTQRELAANMQVSPQMVSSVVKGRENLSLETISKLQIALGIDLISIDFSSPKKEIQYTNIESGFLAYMKIEHVSFAKGSEVMEEPAAVTVKKEMKRFELLKA